MQPVVLIIWVTMYWDWSGTQNMGSIGGEVLEGIQKSISLAEEKYKGLVIANDGTNFSAGANVV